MTNPITDDLPRVSPATPARPEGMPEDGVHAGVDFPTYHGWDACSHSRLEDMKRSAAYCRLRIGQVDESTPDQLDGNATHTAILEPALFDSRYVVVGACCAVTKGGGPCTNSGSVVVAGRSYCRVRGHAPDGPTDPRTPLAADQVAVIEARVAAVRAHSRASRLLDALDATESSVVWTDRLSGLACKARPDRWGTFGGRRVLVDVKRTKDAHPDDFPAAMFRMGWHRQLAWYADGLSAHGLPVDDCISIAVMPDAPHEVYAYRLLDSALAFARLENERLLNDYVGCVRSGRWPAGSEHLLTVDLPEWAKRQMAAEIAL